MESKEEEQEQEKEAKAVLSFCLTFSGCPLLTPKNKHKETATNMTSLTADILSCCLKGFKNLLEFKGVFGSTVSMSLKHPLVHCIALCIGQ